MKKSVKQLKAATIFAKVQRAVPAPAAESDDAFASRAFLDDASDDGLTPAACALALFWAARRERPLDRPAALAHDGAALSLSLVPPKAPKFGGRKRKHVSRLPSVTVTLTH